MDNKTQAIIALILAFLFPLAGLIWGIVVLVKIKNSVDKEGKGFAIAAVAIGFLLTMAPLIIVIGVLSYFGTVEPSTLLPGRCTFPGSFECIDYVVTSDSINLILANGAGRDMKIASVEFSGDSVKGECKATVDKEVANGAKIDVKAIGCSIDSGEREKAWIDVGVNYAYTDSLTIEHKIEGSIITAVAK